MNHLRLTAVQVFSAFMPAIVLCSLVISTGAFAAGSPQRLRTLKPDEIRQIEQAVPDKPAAKPQKPRKILVFWLCNGFYHECIPVANKAIEVLGRKTGAFDVVTSNDMSMFDADKLNQFDAVLFNNTTKLEFKGPARKKALLDFVKNGKGIIGIHAATDNFYDWPEAAEMMGGLFSGHPWTADGIWAMKNAAPNHPINAGFEGKDFKVKDEIYRTKQLNLRDNCHVLLRLDLTDENTKSASGVREQDQDTPVSWIRKYEKGRVFYCGMGHNNEIFRHPAILRHLLAGIQFALGDLPADTTPSGPMKKQ